MTKLTALNDYVFVDALEKDTTSAGGIVLSSVETPCAGVVIAVGPGKFMSNGEREEHNIKIGDVVVFGKSSLNMPHEVDGKNFYVMKTGDIFGKMNS